MVDKVTLADLANLQNEQTAVDLINNNSALIETGFNNTLSRDGTSPNQMNASLDMNSNTILNLPLPNSATEPLRLQDAALLNGGGVITAYSLPTGGTTNQVLAKNSNTSFDVHWSTIGSTPGALPTGGTANQALIKSSGTDYAAAWVSSQPSLALPTGGTTGQYLAKSSGTNYAVAWTSPTSVNTFNVRDYGALGDGSTNDTTAFQNAWNAAKAVKGKVLIPVANSGASYYVSTLNFTSADGVIVEGMGDGSLITCRANGAHFMDLSASSNIILRDFKVTSDSSHVATTIFCWASTAGTNPLKNLTITHVNVDAFSSVAHLFCYGTINGCFKDSTFTQRYNGTVQATNRTLATTVVLLDSTNARSVTSSFVTLSGTISSDYVFENFHAIEFVQGLGASRSNDSAFSMIQAGVLTYIGGSIQSRGVSSLVARTNIENLTFIGTRFQASDGSGTVCLHYMEFGTLGDSIGEILIQNCLFSISVQCVIAFACPVARLNIIAPDVGGGTQPIVGIVGGSTAVDPWIFGGTLIQAQGLDIQVLGNITTNVIIQEPGTMVMSAGVDSSHHF